jgi:hypothetical protein
VRKLPTTEEEWERFSELELPTHLRVRGGRLVPITEFSTGTLRRLVQQRLEKFGARDPISNLIVLAIFEVLVQRGELFTTQLSSITLVPRRRIVQLGDSDA